MMTARPEPTAQGESLKSSANFVHIPFIKTRISEVKEEIDRENAKSIELQRKIDTLMSRKGENSGEEKSWAEVSSGAKGKTSGFTLVQVFAIAVLFLILGNRLAS